MRDLDATTNQRQWNEIIRRRAVMLIQAVQKVSEAIREGKTPEQISALRREAFVALIRLSEASPHDIKGGLREDFQNEMDFILEQTNAKRRT
jgi:hypothetical protein